MKKINIVFSVLVLCIIGAIAYMVYLNHASPSTISQGEERSGQLENSQIQKEIEDLGIDTEAQEVIEELLSEIESYGDEITAESGNQAEELNTADSQIQIIANGTEPFWNFRMSGATSLTFSEPSFSGPMAMTEYEEFELIKQEDTYTLSANEFEAVAKRGICSDGMSDLEYEYEVEVKKGTNQYRGCANIEQ